jgi:hypothetical protein
VAAVVLAAVGGLLLVLGKLGVGGLPGDVLYRRGNFVLYVPLGLMIVISIVLTILLNLRR